MEQAVARSAGTTRYLLDGLSVIAQYAPDGQRQAWYTQSLARIDEALNVANESGKFWYQADALGSVYGLTNQAGALIGSQNYDVFGAPTPAPSGPAGQPFGFTGREHELDSGLVYARDRYVSPALGRWVQQDRAGVDADGPNLYWYASAAPTLRTDPSGQNPITRAVAGFAADQLIEAAMIYMVAASSFTEGGIGSDLILYAAYLFELHVVAKAVEGGSPETCPQAKRPWTISPERTDKVIRHPRFGKFSRHDSTQLWWTKDTAGHGGSVWKVYKQEGNRLVHQFDADEFGDMILKHKGPVGRDIPLSEFFGW